MTTFKFFASNLAARTWLSAEDHIPQAPTNFSYSFVTGSVGYVSIQNRIGLHLFLYGDVDKLTMIVKAVGAFRPGDSQRTYQFRLYFTADKIISESEIPDLRMDMKTYSIDDYTNATYDVLKPFFAFVQGQITPRTVSNN